MRAHEAYSGEPKPKPSPYSAEALAYQEYKKKKKSDMSRQQGETPEQKKWR